MAERYGPQDHLRRKALDAAKSANIKYAETLGDTSVIRRWILIHRAGLVPETKVPTPNDTDGEFEMLRDLIVFYPDARFSVCRLSWNFDLDVEDGHQVIEIANALQDASA